MKLRRSMLFVPGNQPGIIRDVHIYRPDSVIFDLEDAIALTEKDGARFLVYHMLKELGDYYQELGIETVARINGLATPFWREDLKAMVTAGVEVIRLPMTQGPEDVMVIDQEIGVIEEACGRPLGSTKLMVAIETALGVMNAFAIAKAPTKRLVGLAISGEDFVTSMKTTRTPEGDELYTARGLVAMAGRACGLEVLDTVYSDVNNDEGFLQEARLIKRMGFGGKSLIHPRQVALIHQVFTPTSEEVAKARKIVDATCQAERENRGVFTVDGKMVDKPIIERAKRVLELAAASGIAVGGEEV